jgi:hypothetical protein
MGELSKEFLVERDTRIFALKKSGLSNSEIGKRFDMTASAVAAAVRRQLDRLNKEAFLSYPEVLRLELERLDEMQKSLWPMTQYRREELDDGSVVMVEPDQKAIQTVLGIMDRRAKLLGMNVERVDIALSGTAGDAIDVRSTLAGVDAPTGVLSSADAAKDESLKLLEIMSAAGILDENVVSGIMRGMDDDVIEAEVVDPEEDENVK